MTSRAREIFKSHSVWCDRIEFETPQHKMTLLLAKCIELSGRNEGGGGLVDIALSERSLKKVHQCLLIKTNA